MALTLCEAGARAIYCIDLPGKPGEEWEQTREYVSRMGNGTTTDYNTAINSALNTTTHLLPVQKLDASLASHAITPRTSLALPIRPIGFNFDHFSNNPGCLSK
jgi:hypothetical protein